MLVLGIERQSLKAGEVCFSYGCCLLCMAVAVCLGSFRVKDLGGSGLARRMMMDSLLDDSEKKKNFFFYCFWHDAN